MRIKTLCSLALLLTFAAIGSGAAQYAHQLDHLREDLADHDHQKSPHHHDEQHCAICTVLQMPSLSQPYTPILISLGILILFSREIILISRTHRHLSPIVCRGPPYWMFDVEC